MLFSIIVPVYNVQKYISQCLDSLLKQNYYDFEILLIDDGSSDKSGDICDEYALKDKRVHVFHQTNRGLSRARNVGIAKASGDYLVFVDSDDWVEPNSLSEFKHIIDKFNPEVIETSLVEEYPNKTIKRDRGYSAYLAKGFNRERALRWILFETENRWPAPKRICNRDFVLRNELFFAEGRLQEDIDWTARLCCYAQSFGGYALPWYHYRMKREGSISNSVQAKYITDIIEMAASDRKICQQGDRYAKAAFNKMMRSVYISINLMSTCNLTDKTIVKDTIENNMWIFNCAPSLKYKMFALAVKTIGLDHSLSLLTIVNKIMRKI